MPCRSVARDDVDQRLLEREVLRSSAPGRSASFSAASTLSLVTSTPWISTSLRSSFLVATRKGKYAFQKPEYCGASSTVLSITPSLDRLRGRARCRRPRRCSTWSCLPARSTTPAAGHGQAVAVAVDQVEVGIGGHPVLGDRDGLGRIPAGRLLRDHLHAGILRHHVGEAAGTVGVEALAEQALQVGDLALHLAVVARLQQLGRILADDLAGVALVEAEHRRAALDLRMQADHRDVRPPSPWPWSGRRRRHR